MLINEEFSYAKIFDYEIGDVLIPSNVTTVEIMTSKNKEYLAANKLNIKSTAQTVQRLIVYSANIKSIGELMYFRNVEQLEIYGSKFVDFSGIEYFSHLKKLQIKLKSKKRSLSFLNIPSLIELETNILSEKDELELKELKNLKKLCVNGWKSKDFTTLMGLHHDEVFIEGGNILSTKGLEKAKQIVCRKCRNLNEIAKSSSLRHLQLFSCNSLDISTLSNASNLLILEIQSFKHNLNNCEFIKKLKKLRMFLLWQSSVPENLDSIVQCKSLKWAQLFTVPTELIMNASLERPDVVFLNIRSILFNAMELDMDESLRYIRNYLHSDI